MQTHSAVTEPTNQAEAVPAFEREHQMASLLLQCHEFLYCHVADHQTIAGRRATALVNQIRTLI